MPRVYSARFGSFSNEGCSNEGCSNEGCSNEGCSNGDEDRTLRSSTSRVPVALDGPLAEGHHNNHSQRGHRRTTGKVLIYHLCE